MLCESLPPCSNVPDLHIARSNYQTEIWRKAMAQFMNVDDLSMNDDGLMDIKWMTCKPAPDEVNLVENRL